MGRFYFLVYDQRGEEEAKNRFAKPLCLRGCTGSEAGNSVLRVFNVGGIVWSPSQDATPAATLCGVTKPQGEEGAPGLCSPGRRGLAGSPREGKGLTLP